MAVRGQLGYVLLVDEHRVLARELGRTCVLKDIQAVQDARVDGITMSNHSKSPVRAGVPLCII